jgi:signal transduction histidine kinase
VAIAELRELAHGIFPAVLADDGLDAAVHALAEEAGVPMRVGDLPPARFDQELETAAYTVVAETVRAARGSVSVSARQENGMLAVELATARVDGLDVVALEDRLGALDGRLEVEAGDGATTVRAELPCGS